MTNQKAITLIEEIRPKKCKMVDGRLQGGYPDHDSDIGKAIDIAIEALEKQIPKKPSQDSIGLYYFPTCPNCHKEIESYDHHCECGQALDWSE